MTLKRLSFEIKKDIILKKGSLISMITDANKFWLNANDRQITFPKQGFKVKDSPEKLWLNKNNVKS